jgi:hypothetical protein
MQALARRAAAPVFALAMFSSAALIFVLQPLFARMVTPLLGGSPAVWNTSMAFFQAALLAGYVYAHLLARLKDIRVQAAIHAVVLVLAWLVLPLHVSNAMGPPDSFHPALWLLGVLTLSAGAPFAAASATAPLLQSWYARTGRADAHDPYYLYAASNLGSFVGLLGYPILIEPLLGAHAQSLAWASGYVLVAGMIVFSGATAIASHGDAPKAETHVGPAPTWNQRLFWMAAAAVPSALVLGVTLHILTDVASAPMIWVVPLALYLATFVLAFMRNNERLEKATLFIHPIAMALLVISYYSTRNWVGSISGILAGFFFSALVCHLALSRSRPSADRLTEFYLFTSLGGVLGGAFAAFLAPVIFNNVYEYPLALAAACLFRPRAAPSMPRLSDASIAAAVMVGITALALNMASPVHAALIVGALGAAAAMVAAGWGEDNRPPAMRYAFLAIAAVHSLLVIWIAFHVDTYFVTRRAADGFQRLELLQPWTLGLLATSFLVLVFAVHGTIQRRIGNNRVSDFAYGAAMPTLIFLVLLALIGSGFDATKMIVAGLYVCCAAILLNYGRPLVMGAVILISFFIIFLDEAMGSKIITQERSFFGVLRTRVIEDPTNPHAPPLRILMHGTTIHGAQLAAPLFSRQPLTYYNPHTALGDAIVAGLSASDNAHLALIGLGAGSTACLMTPRDHLTIFEIDPAVVRLSAMQGGNFTYVTQCQPHADIRLGDARLQIANEPDSSYNVIVVDAFTSDAIPAHLLTREALALYLRKATPDGIVILHLSNRNLALVSEAARVARDLHVPTLYRLSDPINVPYTGIFGGLSASVMIVARSPATLSRLRLQSADWRIFPAPPGVGWSDDYINMSRALWEGLNGAENCRISPYVEGCASMLTPEERAAATPAATMSPSPAPQVPRRAP